MARLQSVDEMLVHDEKEASKAQLIVRAAAASDERRARGRGAERGDRGAWQ